MLGQISIPSGALNKEFIYTNAMHGNRLVVVKVKFHKVIHKYQ